MTEKEKMLAGELYNPTDEGIQNDHRAAMAWLVRYNACLGYRAEERRQLMLERFAQVGQGVDIRPPFHCDYGFNISIADGNGTQTKTKTINRTRVASRAVSKAARRKTRVSRRRSPARADSRAARVVSRAASRTGSAD